MMNRRFKNIDFLFDEIMKWSNYINGQTKTEKGSDKHGNWVKKTYKSEDGSFMSTTFVREYTNERKNELQGLKYQMEELVAKENFEEAIKIRDKIKKLEKSEDELLKLKEQLEEYVKNEDFENAIKVRDKIKNLKS